MIFPKQTGENFKKIQELEARGEANQLTINLEYLVVNAPELSDLFFADWAARCLKEANRYSSRESRPINKVDLSKFRFDPSFL